MDLFDIASVLPPLEVKVEQAKSAIAGVMKKGHLCVVAWSSGKDSTAVLVLVLEVAQEMIAVGYKPKIVVTTSDTLVENP